VRRHAGLRQSGAIHWGPGGHPFRPVLTGCHALVHVDRPCTLPGISRPGNRSTSTHPVTARKTRTCPAVGRCSPGGPTGERSRATFSKRNRISEGDGGGNRCYRPWASNHSSEPPEDALYRFACPNSQTASQTCTEENFNSEITRYRKRCFWSRGGYRFLERS